MYLAAATSDRAASAAVLAGRGERNGEASALLAGVMEALSMVVIVCDGQGAVRAASASAEALLRCGEHLRIRQGRLVAAEEADRRALPGALRAMAASRSGSPMFLRVNSSRGADPLLLELASVPGEPHPSGREDAVLLMVRAPHRHPQHRSALIARALFGLTAAESAIAADLAAGLTPTTIAARRGISVQTVRTHIRRAFEKAGVRSQLELIAAINARS